MTRCHCVRPNSVPFPWKLSRNCVTSLRPPSPSAPDLPSAACSSLLYYLYAHDCEVILKFTDDNAVVGLMTTTSSPGGLVLREAPPAERQQSKGADNGQQQRDYWSRSSAVQRQTFKTLEVTVPLDLSWSNHSNVAVKSPRQHLYLLGGSETLSCRLKVLKNF